MAWVVTAPVGRGGTVTHRWRRRRGCTSLCCGNGKAGPSLKVEWEPSKWRRAGGWRTGWDKEHGAAGESEQPGFTQATQRWRSSESNPKFLSSKKCRVVMNHRKSAGWKISLSSSFSSFEWILFNDKEGCKQIGYELAFQKSWFHRAHSAESNCGTIGMCLSPSTLLTRRFLQERTLLNVWCGCWILYFFSISCFYRFVTRNPRSPSWTQCT